MNKFDYEREIPYVVYLKCDSPLWVSCCQMFCGYLVNNTDGNFYFELNKSRMLIVVPHSDIQYMYPSKKHFKAILAKEIEKEKTL